LFFFEYLKRKYSINLKKFVKEKKLHTAVSFKKTSYPTATAEMLLNLLYLYDLSKRKIPK